MSEEAARVEELVAEVHESGCLLAINADKFILTPQQARMLAAMVLNKTNVHPEA